MLFPVWGGKEIQLWEFALYLLLVAYPRWTMAQGAPEGMEAYGVPLPAFLLLKPLCVYTQDCLSDVHAIRLLSPRFRRARSSYLDTKEIITHLVFVGL